MARPVVGTGRSGSCLLHRHEGSGKALECDWEPCTCNCHPRNGGRGEPIVRGQVPETTETESQEED